MNNGLNFAEELSGGCGRTCDMHAIYLMSNGSLL